MRLHLISVANVSVATSTTNINVPLPEGQRCWRLNGDPHIWRLLRSFHLVDALSAEPGPEQSSAGLLLPLGCLCNDWWVTFCFFLTAGFLRFLTPWSPEHFLIRHPLPVDVLAQLQLGHHGPRGRAAQSRHQHLPGFGLDCAHHCGHLEPLPEARQARHGNDMLQISHKHSHQSDISDKRSGCRWGVYSVLPDTVNTPFTNISQIDTQIPSVTDAIVSACVLSGSHPELHSCRRRRSGNCCRVHADALRVSDRRLLLWYHLHTGIYLPHGMVLIGLLCSSYDEINSCQGFQAISYKTAAI